VPKKGDKKGTKADEDGDQKEEKEEEEGDGDEPPTLRNLWKSDGLGKLCTFFTSAWGVPKKRAVVSFFAACSVCMALYARLADGKLDLEVALSYLVSAAFLAAAAFFLLAKQKRPEKEADEIVTKDDLKVDFRMKFDLELEAGKVVMVIGSVGCGKSSVLQVRWSSHSVCACPTSDGCARQAGCVCRLFHP
jgi:hypothetical protein